VPVAFSVFKERLGIVIVLPRFVPHGNGLDPERAAARIAVAAKQYRTQKIIETFAERRSSGQTFTFHLGHHIIIECKLPESAGQKPGGRAEALAPQEIHFD
jgi:hypothetical protein